jgi:hypothetical protein
MTQNKLISALNYYITENKNIEDDIILDIINILYKIRTEINSEILSMDDFTTNDLHVIMSTLNFYVIKNKTSMSLNNERKLLYNIKVIYDNRILNEQNYNM